MSETDYTPVPTFESPDGRKGFAHINATHFTKRDCIIVLVVVAIAVIAIIVTLSLGLPVINEKRAQYFNITFSASSSPLRTFQKSAVIADAEPCAPIGSNILQIGGSAVDAAIAMLLCDGAANPQSMGIGGGLFMTVYINGSDAVEVIDGREAAPQDATADMFLGNSSLLHSGPLSVAVPGELKAYWTAHQKYGKLNWSSLIDPTVHLCRNGFPVGYHLAATLKDLRQEVLNEPTLRELFYNNNTQDIYKEGEYMRRPVLADTLEEIAKKGADEFYSGEIGRKFVEDVRRLGGLITEEDLKAYKVKVKAATKSTVSGGLKLYSVPPPGSGAVLSMILNIMDGYNYTSASEDLSIDDTTLMYHRFVEALKFSFAKRSYLGDEDFVNVSSHVADMLSRQYADSIREQKISDKETHEPEYYGPDGFNAENKGTAQVSVLAPNGDAVSATSTVNAYFGALLRSTSTGIILNNGMDDFSVENATNRFGVHWSPSNLIAPGKRPMSSMCPAILLDADGKVKIVYGGAGGTRITSAAALILFRNLYLKENIKQAIDGLRLHHQLFPNEIYYEKGFPRVLLDSLRDIGHRLKEEVEHSSFQGIVRLADGTVTANMDNRKRGSVEGV
ncbi:scoloptoxin SSD14-like isoform X2 [Ornithodoros turicata]|uniref:scoloptoxin SSD14-like isoform X2 n=1 Tax=Ornithodoros turicata TaxID=34597 RepID=UPI003139E329